MKKIILFILILCTSAFAEEAKFSNESELSAVTTGGNSELETYNAITKNKYNLNTKNLVGLGGHYTFGTSSGVLSARNWDINLRYEHVLSKRFNIYFGEIVEGDKFSGFSERYNSDLGFKYTITKTDKTNLFSELGYRYSIEKATDGTETKDHKARVYLEGTRHFTKTFNSKLWVEYLPNFSDSEDWLLSFEPSLGFVINSSFSLKLAYKGTYDNKPAATATKKFDYQYTTALIAKF